MSPKLTPSREVAYDSFVEVMENKKKPEEITEVFFAKQSPKLNRIDKNLVKEILYGSLRWFSKIYWIVQNTSNRDLDKASPQIRSALVLGTYQIFYMDRIPDRAAVNESVEYIRKKGQSHAVKFVNGILRSIARRSEYFAKPDKDQKPVDYLSLQFAHPHWLVDRWFKRFSFDRLKDLLAENNKVPPYSIRINAAKVHSENIQEFRARLLKEDKNHSDRKSLRSCLTLKSAPNFAPESLFDQGYYSIQDEASQLIGHLVDPQAGELIVEACSGPGGKLGHVYELSEGQNVRLIGVEKDKDQLEKAKKNFERLGHQERISWVHADFLDFKPTEDIDRILLDSPCSGLGVIRRHPEGKWQKNLTIVTRLAKIQETLITHALSILKPGGELIYSVCSFEPEETSQHLKWINAKFGDKIEVVSPLNRIPDYYKKFVTRDKVLLIYSGNKDMMDGFGAFILKKQQ